jgi:hypothetical protein
MKVKFSAGFEVEVKVEVEVEVEGGQDRVRLK